MPAEQRGEVDQARKGELSYKYQRLRERLRTAIKTGELIGKLPGERELARRYAANAKTINKALNDLAMEGLLLRHVGRGTFVAGSGPRPSRPYAGMRRYSWITSTLTDVTDEESLYNAARGLLEGHRRHLARLRVELDGSGELPDNTLSLRELRRTEGVVIFSAKPSWQLLANLRRGRLTVVLINNYHDAVRLPSVLCDQSHGAFTLCNRFILLGHRAIRLALQPRSLPAASAAVAGYRAAMNHYGLSPLPVAEIGPTPNWAGLFTGPDRPTALICVSGELAHRAAGKAAAASLKVPADLSIAALCEPGETAAEKASICAYEVESRRVLNWVGELVMDASPVQPPPLVVVPGRLIDRRTTAPPPGKVDRPADPTKETTL
ncbi:MAG: GntR family transcriptional regulator [Planctomycetes bacterium]|nr:GntR family transcriptional regulator [Planctomycetota bacterium]